MSDALGRLAIWVSAVLLLAGVVKLASPALSAAIAWAYVQKEPMRLHARCEMRDDQTLSCSWVFPQ